MRPIEDLFDNHLPSVMLCNLDALLDLVSLDQKDVIPLGFLTDDCISTGAIAMEI